MDNQDPKVIYTPEALKPLKKRWFKAKLIFLPLLAVIAIEIVFGMKTLLTPVPVTKAHPLAPVGRAKLSIIVPQLSYKVGDTIPVELRLTTEGYTSAGTDLILNYDPKLLEASAGAFVQGPIYTDYPFINIDTKSGVINASGVASVSQKGFKGKGVFGTVNFKAKANGKTTLTIDFKANSINKTNVIDAGTTQNILDQVSPLELEIK